MILYTAAVDIILVGCDDIGVINDFYNTPEERYDMMIILIIIFTLSSINHRSLFRNSHPSVWEEKDKQKNLSSINTTS